jgi:hypothetical protein
MPSYNTNLKTWGSTGQEYPDNYNYVEGEQPVDAWDNFLTSNVINDIEHLIDTTNNELIARDGTVAMNDDLPLGGNNIDGVGDIVDSNSNTVYDVSEGWIPAERIEQGNGSGLDADTLGGKNESELDVDKVDGKDAAEISQGLPTVIASGSSNSTSTSIGKAAQTVIAVESEDDFENGDGKMYIRPVNADNPGSVIFNQPTTANFATIEPNSQYSNYYDFKVYEL